MTEDDVYDTLPVAVPETQPLLARHVERWHNVRDVFLLMDDLLAAALQWHKEGHSAALSNLLTFVERCLIEGDEVVRDAVVTDFVGYTPPWDPKMERFVDAWPQALQAAGRMETLRFTGEGDVKPTP